MSGRASLLRRLRRAERRAEHAADKLKKRFQVVRAAGGDIWAIKNGYAHFGPPHRQRNNLGRRLGYSKHSWPHPTLDCGCKPIQVYRFVKVR